MSFLFALKIQAKRLLGGRSFGRISYSQEGEDIVISKLFPKNFLGVYVDIGCNHPCHYSNTYYFYRKGWKGLCVDPLPGLTSLFKKYRSRDTYIQVGVSNKSEKLTYYNFNETLLNTFDENLANKRMLERPNLKILNTEQVEVLDSSTLMERYFTFEKLDLLSIDVEGCDYDVLISFPLEKYEPTAIVIEDADSGKHLHSNISEWLNNFGYFRYAITGFSHVYIRNKNIMEYK